MMMVMMAMMAMMVAMVVMMMELASAIIKVHGRHRVHIGECQTETTGCGHCPKRWE